MAGSFDGTALSKLTARIDSKLSEGRHPDRKRKPTSIAPSSPPPKKNKKSHGSGKDTKGAKKPSQDVNLLDEIKALGGNEDDLELVDGIDSDDSEPAGHEAPGPSKDAASDKLRAELADFAVSLGFENVPPEPEVDSDPEISVNGEDDGEGSKEDMNNSDSGGQGDESEDEPAVKAFQKPSSDQVGKKAKAKTVFEPRPDWHAVSLKSLQTPASEDVAPFSPAMENLKTHAKSLLEQDTVTYTKGLSASSSHKFMSTIMSSGTMTDKVSALTLAIQESPVHSTKAFESLLGLASKRSRGQALAALGALVDLLGPGTILPSDRRLRSFSAQLGLVGTLQKHNIKSWNPKQPLPGKVSAEHLIAWAFEDWLKEAYFKMIQALEVWCDDEVEYARTKAVDLVFALLRDKPEQESNLLRLLVNKLGDRQRKIASRASYSLLQLLNLHPGMKTVVVRAVEQDVLFRQGQNLRAKYYAINTLNQTILSTREPDLAESLLRIYFSLFVSLLKNKQIGQTDESNVQTKKSHRAKARPPPQSVKPPVSTSESSQPDPEAAEKLVSAILTGINRAVPFSQTDQSTLESHLDTLFRITHSSNFNTSIQALMLIQQLSTSRHVATDRFYRTLYESLLDPRLSTSSKQTLYLNLLFRSLRSDIDVRRVKAFVKRMLQTLNLHQASFVCGILYLVAELCITFPDLKTLLNVPEEHDMEESGLSAHGDTGHYDGRKRDPEYSNAHRSCLWELVSHHKPRVVDLPSRVKLTNIRRQVPFLKHFHPSVDVYAGSLLSGQNTTQKPDLANHTLIAFLDKFVYRNAKVTDQVRGASIMQPVAADGQAHVLLSNKSSSNSKPGSSLNTASFWNQKSENVAADEVFFHEYFAQVGKPNAPKKSKTSKVEAVDAEEAGSAEEDEIWDALVSSHPEVQEDTDSDPEFDDLMGLDDSDGEDDSQVASDQSFGEQGDDAMDSDSDGGVEFVDNADSDLGEADGDEDGFDGSASPADTPAKGAAKPNEERRARKKAFKSLPTFASIDDYADMLDGDEDF